MAFCYQWEFFIFLFNFRQILTVTKYISQRIIKWTAMNDQAANLKFRSEKSLFLRIKKYKDREAFLAAYDLYVDQIWRFIYFKIGNKEEAQDLTSAVFLKCWGYVSEGRLNDSDDYRTLKSFLYKIARNLAIDYYRQLKPRAGLEAATGVAADSDEGLAAERLTAAIDFELLIDELQKLKSEYRTVLVLKYINDLSIAEIADILGKSKGNVRVTVYRALEALKELTNHHDRKGTASSIE